LCYCCHLHAPAILPAAAGASSSGSCIGVCSLIRNLSWELSRIHLALHVGEVRVCTGAVCVPCAEPQTSQGRPAPARTAVTRPPRAGPDQAAGGDGGSGRARGRALRRRPAARVAALQPPGHLRRRHRGAACAQASCLGVAWANSVHLSLCQGLAVRCCAQSSHFSGHRGSGLRRQGMLMRAC